MPEITLANWWDSKAEQRLDVVATLAAVVVVVRVGLQEEIGWLGAVAVGLAALTLAAIRWPYGTLVLLTGASALPVFFVEVFGWKARPEHFAGVLILAAVGMRRLVVRKRWHVEPTDFWIAAYVFLNFFSSAFGSPDPTSTLRWALQNCFAVLFYFLIRVLVQDAKTLHRGFAILLTVGVIESIYGIGCYWSHQLFGTSTGVTVGQYLYDVAASFGTMYEPNLFGAYAASCSVMFLALYLFGGHRSRHFLCFLICGFASLVSFSRASLAALAIVAAYLFWKNHRTSPSKDQGKIFAVVITCLVILTLLAGSIGGVLRERFTNLFYEGLTEETALSRVIVMQEALQEIPGHLLIGRGTASFNLTFDWARYMPEWAGDKTWIGNAPLRILHDTGLFGLLVVVGFFVTVWMKIRGTLRKPAPQNSTAMSLWVGVLVYTISFQSTDGTILAFTWAQLGFLAAAASLLKELIPGRGMTTSNAD